MIHLHPTHFRFDQQEGSFSYKSPMKMVLEHIRSGTIPHDLIEYFTDVPFYEGCMIVQIYDHKSAAPAHGSTRTNTGATKTVPFSVHNYNAYLTPSSYVPYPAQNTISGKGKLITDEVDDKSKSAEQTDKENMPAPSIPNDGQRNKGAGPRKPKIHTTVLHPTPLSSHVDLATKAAEARFGIDGRKDSRQDGGPLSATVPPTPTTAIPSTPQISMAPPAKRVKRTKVDLDSANIHAAEGQIVHLTTAPLNLDPVGNAREMAALLDSLAHPMHSEKPPLPKSRKRTVAEMAADEAFAAEQERYMLILDERLSSNTVNAQGGANPTDGDGQAGGASFEPRFEKFKALENIKNQHEENKKIEKQRRDEAERKLQQERERNKLRDEAKERDQEKLRNMAAQQQQAARHQQQQQQAQQEAHRRSQIQAQQLQQGMQAQVQAQHAHPQANGTMANGLPQQSQRFHQQQVSQAQASSPIVRNETPQSHSSPTVNTMGNVPMQQSTSSMGGSPPRPGSVVQQGHPQMGAPPGMSAQRSQQSHAGTPRMPNSTPNVQSTPLNRQMSQTPRMSQGSPMQGPMAEAPQMQQMMQMNPALQQQRLQMMQNQQAAQRMGGMMGGQQMQQMSPQQIMQAQMSM
jgi:transcription factor SPT20